jgi:hypothetical protein
MMLPEDVICLEDPSSAMGVAVKESGIDSCVLMIEGGNTLAIVLNGKARSVKIGSIELSLMRLETDFTVYCIISRGYCTTELEIDSVN